MPVVPRKFGDVAPQETVMDAYQRGGVPAAFGSIMNAPDPGLGPMAVVQKAGAPLLRGLLNRQTAAKLAKLPGKKAMGEVSANARSAVASLTPMVKGTARKVEKAVTGKPLSVVGHRTETGGVVPGRGTFFAAKPADAIPRSPTRAASAIEMPGGPGTGHRVDALKFKNPLVFQAGSQFEALKQMARSPETKPGLRKLANKMLDESITEKWFTRADKMIARAAKDMGHDGIVYKGPGFIVDLEGTKNIAKGK